MNDFCRDNPLFSLCGLNCGLCQMYVGRYCPGCGGGDGNRTCALLRCAREHGDVPYCFLCGEYPCERYAGFDTYDSFLPGRNWQKDAAHAREMGVDAYMEELHKKMEMLQTLLSGYNDGRRKSFFLTAVYLLDLTDCEAIMRQLPGEDTPLPARAAIAVERFASVAGERGVDLKLHKKPKQK